MTLKKKQKHTKTMHIIFVITLINCMVKVSYANAITATSPQEVEIGGDVTLEWTLMPSTGKQVNAITLSRLLDSEDTLWRSAAKNVAGTGVDERFVKLKNVLGDRVTIEEVTRKGFEIFKLSIKSLNFSDSIVLNVKASFGPAGDFPTHEGFVNKTIVLKVVEFTTTRQPPPTVSSPSGGSNSGTIIAIVIGVVLVVVLLIIVSFIVYRKKRSRPVQQKRPEESSDFIYSKGQQQTSEYAPVGTGVDQDPSQKQPPKQKYAQLGPGGRNGPKDPIIRTQYAEARDDDGGHNYEPNRYSAYSDNQNEISEGVIV